MRRISPTRRLFRLPVLSSGTEVHPLDVLIAWLGSRSKMFSQGWGDESFLETLTESDPRNYSGAPIAIDWRLSQHRDRFRCSNGTFTSPLSMLPPGARQVHVRSLTRDGHREACLLLAGSRDEGFAVRERIFGPLTERGLDLYLTENPFYGIRRTGAGGPNLATVSDHILMVIGILWEAQALLAHLHGQYQKLTVAGYSMGGHMAAIAAALSPFPVASAVLATGASASVIYTRSLLSWSVDFDALGNKAMGSLGARERLCRLFDLADVTRFPPPMRTNAAVIVGCARDGYVPGTETERLHRQWPGSTLRWVNGGHFSSLVTCRRALCDSISEAAEKL